MHRADELQPVRILRERSLHGKLVHTPVEYGSINLLPADPLLQHTQGLYGALIIEPLGSTWSDDEAYLTSATVTKRDNTKFRDLVAITLKHVVGRGKNAVGNTVLGFNYKSEYLDYRFNEKTKPSQVPLKNKNMACILSNSWIPDGKPGQRIGEPQTPVFQADPGIATRFRMLYPGGAETNGEIPVIHGHVWQEEPYSEESREIGFNPLSQWQGARMGHGPTHSFDVVLERVDPNVSGGAVGTPAGGPFEITGDYLIATMQAGNMRQGEWALFRVGNPPDLGFGPVYICGPDSPTVTVAAPQLDPDTQDERAANEDRGYDMLVKMTGRAD